MSSENSLAVSWIQHTRWLIQVALNILASQKYAESMVELPSQLCPLSEYLRIPAINTLFSMSVVRWCQSHYQCISVFVAALLITGARSQHRIVSAGSVILPCSLIRLASHHANTVKMSCNTPITKEVISDAIASAAWSFIMIWLRLSVCCTSWVDDKWRWWSVFGGARIGSLYRAGKYSYRRDVWRCQLRLGNSHLQMPTGQLQKLRRRGIHMDFSQAWYYWRAFASEWQDQVTCLESNSSRVSLAAFGQSWLKCFPPQLLHRQILTERDGKLERNDAVVESWCSIWTS